MIYASISSVYGRFAYGDESLPINPISPFDVTNLNGENLCGAYADTHDSPPVALSDKIQTEPGWKPRCSELRSDRRDSVELAQKYPKGYG
jgi:hypothetical protein